MSSTASAARIQRFELRERVSMGAQEASPSGGFWEGRRSRRAHELPNRLRAAVVLAATESFRHNRRIFRNSIVACECRRTPIPPSSSRC
jgi:hypothetical protein